MVVGVVLLIVCCPCITAVGCICWCMGACKDDGTAAKATAEENAAEADEEQAAEEVAEEEAPAEDVEVQDISAPDGEDNAE